MHISLRNTSCALVLGLPHKGACGGERRDSACTATIDFRWEADVREQPFFPSLLFGLSFRFTKTPTLFNGLPVFCVVRHISPWISFVEDRGITEALTRLCRLRVILGPTTRWRQNTISRVAQRYIWSWL